MTNQLPQFKAGRRSSAVLCMLFAVSLFFNTSLKAQVSVFQFSGNGGNPAVNAPISKSVAKWSSSAMLYPASGFNGGNGFGTIQKVGYSCDGGFFSGSSIPIKIWITTVPVSTTTLSGSTWSAATSGATLVYTGNFNQGAAGGWCDITLTTPFAWSSGNLVVLVESDWGTTTTVVGDPNWDYNNSTGNTDVNWTSNTSAAALASSTACCSTPDNFRADIELTVNTCTPPSISGQPSTTAQNICVNGTSTALSVTATGTGTLTYQWYQNAANNNTSGTLIAGATGSSYTPLTTSAGALYYYCVVTSGCSTTSNTSGLVTVTGPPSTPGSITGSTSVCALSTNSYSVASVNGATSYTWTLPTGWSGSSTTNSISATQGTGGGTISVTANSGCGNSTAQTLAVSLLAPPATPTAILGPDSVCPTSTNTFSVNAVNGATFYTWTLPSGWSGTSTTSNISATQGTGPGTISVTANNTCGNSSAQTLAVTLASPPGTLGSITGVDSGCATNQITYSVTSVSGATSYTWTLPNGWTGTSITNSILATLGSTSGNVSVTANNTCGSTGAQTLAVNVISPPAMPTSIIGPGSACGANPVTYSVAPVSGATSYAWTLPATWSGSSTTDSISATPGASGGTISVIAHGFCGNSSAQTLAITLGSIPAMPSAILGPVSVCGSSANNTYSINAVNGATSYTWTLPNGWSGTSTTATIIVTAGSTGGTISVTANNTCGSSNAQTVAVSVVSGVPSMPGSIAQAGSACTGGMDTFSIASVNGASSYTWTLPNTWSGSSTTNNIIATAGTGGGNVSVTANNVCGSSSAQSAAISLGASPAMPGTINGPITVCGSSANNTYTINSVSGATSYTWILPNGWTGTSTTETIVVSAGSSQANIGVYANNACGSSLPQMLTVNVVSAAPATPGIITQTGNACTGGTDTFTIAPVNGATSYTWTLPNTWAGGSTNDSIVATVGTSGGNISVIANNGCGSSSAQTSVATIGSTPATPASIFGADSVCSSTTNNTYAVTPVNGATSYTWTLPNGWSGTSTTAVIVTAAGTTGGTISVTANNACGSSTAQTLNVTVSPTPVVSFSYPGGPVCNNLNPVVTLSGGSPAGGTYSGQGVSGTTFNATGLSAGNYTLTYSVTTAGCPGSDTANVSVEICIGIADVELDPISVYPNPFSNAITINTKGNYNNGTAILMDAAGRELSRQQLATGAINTELNTQGLANGVYVISIVFDNNIIAVKKLVRID